MANVKPTENGSLCGTSSFELHDALERHQTWLRSVVLARLQEPQAVDDVMQEIAVALSRNRAPLADPAKMAPWLYQIAVRQSLLYRRKQGRRRKLVDRFAERGAPSESQDREPNPLEWLLARERANHIRKACGQLSSRDREVLALKYGHDWSYKRIGEHLDLSESAVEARLHRARQRLRNLLLQMDMIEA
jgi:RNA polymerase sigma-70 factor (ECF subfamily)